MRMRELEDLVVVSMHVFYCQTLWLPSFFSFAT